MTPKQVQINIDATNRTVTITHRGQLDIAPSAVELPFSVIKQLAGQIITGEGAAEQQQAQSRASLVRPT